MEFDLVFEGGGAKGNVFVGALQAFDAAGHTARRYMGTSAGAITACMLAAGYSAQELLQLVNERLPDGRPRFASFMDAPDSFSEAVIKDSVTWKMFEKVDLPFIPNMIENSIDERIIAGLMKLPAYRTLFSFVERGGLYAGDAFYDWLLEKLNARAPGLGKVSLAEFNQSTGSDLTVIASDTSTKDMLVLNHRTAPKCPVAKAVRMSMALPFIWQEVIWDADWGEYCGKDISGNSIVDGGMLSNFPIELFEGDEERIRRLMGDTDPAGAGTLGMLIDENLKVEGAPPREEEGEGPEILDKVEGLRTVRRAKKLLDTLTDAHDRFDIAKYPEKVCHLPAKGYGTTEFDMSDTRLKALLAAGQAAMEQWLAKSNA